MKKGIYTACYPLHDGHSDKEDPDGGKSQRMVILIHKTTDKKVRQYQNIRKIIFLLQILRMEWANWYKIFHNQPISRIAQYYGQKIGNKIDLEECIQALNVIE